MPETQTIAKLELPESLAAYAGEFNDADGHESIPMNHWAEIYGSGVGRMVDYLEASPGHIGAGKKEADEGPIDAKTTMRDKMEKAPGAWDMDRRIEVMDFLGVHRQVLYPGNMPLFGVSLFVQADDMRRYPMITEDRRKYATQLIDLHNDWCGRVGRAYDRLRPVGVVVGETPDKCLAVAKALERSGVRLMMVPAEEPPGGVSPAAPEMDPLWAFAADAGMCVHLHIGPNGSFLKSDVWKEAPAFKGWRVGAEVAVDPYILANSHLPAQNYLLTMIMGGVFDRHPKLRFCISEYGGHWVGPLAENMDRLHSETGFSKFNDGSGVELKKKPSEYISTNVRVSLFDFEPAGQYIERHGLEDVFCYASDYPHHEGGSDYYNDFANSLKGHSAAVHRKFFVENARMMLPD